MATNRITFVPSNLYAEAYIPAPELAIKNIPEWYRTHERYDTKEPSFAKNGTVNQTIKKCMAVFDSMTAGYLLKFPVDIRIDATGKRISYTQANPEEQGIVSMHSPEQVRGLPFDRDMYMDEIFKIHPKWLVKTEPGTSCLFTHPIFFDDLPFRIINGTIDTDNFMSDGAFSMLIKRGFVGVISKGTPLVQVIPFRREEYAMEIGKYSDYSDEIIQQRQAVRSTFENGYKEQMWERKIYT